MTASDANSAYASYMLEQIDALDAPDVPVGRLNLERLKSYWRDGEPLDLQQVREQLWGWVDGHGGPRMEDDQSMLFVRMVLCLAYDDNRELEDIGFFEDLLSGWARS